MNVFTDVVAFVSYILAAYAVGVKIVLLWYYSISDYRKKLWPRILIGVSHILLVLITVLSLNFRIFSDGVSRFVGSIAALIALGMAAVGMTLMVKREHAAHILDLADPSRLERENQR